MHFRFTPRAFSYALSALLTGTAAFATTPVVTVAAPADGTITTSPINFLATATSPNCAKGISAVEIYSAPGVSAAATGSGNLNTYINLPKGTYNTVVQAFDNCGGVGKADVTITITGEAQPGGFVYTTNTDYTPGQPNKANYVEGFTIVAGNGALARTWQGPVKANVFPRSVTSDKGGYRLYVGDFISGDVYPYFINRGNGYLTPVPGAPFPVDHSVMAVAVHPSGKLVFAARSENNSGDGVSVFEVQSNGSLVEAPGSPYDTQPGPQAMVVDPSGKYLYVVENVGYINAFSIDEASATLTALPGSPFTIPVPANCSADDMAAAPQDIIDPIGAYLYTADAGMESISGFSIANGALTSVAGSPWADNGGCKPPIACDYGCPNVPNSIAVDGTGKFLYGVNGELGTISIYSIAADGALTYIKDVGNTADSPDVGCSGPIRTDSTGTYIYVGSCGVNVPNGYRGLVGFSINHTTGDLTELPSSPYTYPALTINTALQSFTVTP